MRDYPLGSEAAHVLGYLGQIQKEQLDSPQYKGYGQSDLVGRAGLELQYEKYLRGTNGEQKFIVNANGDTIRALGAIPPTPGDTLDLTIDSKVQKDVEDELVRGLENARNQVDEAGGKGLYLQAPAGRRGRDGRADGRRRRDGVVAHLRPELVREGPHAG